jgi:hypothetical protein
VAESRVISDLITGTCEGWANGQHVKVDRPVRFLYDPSDPYAVTLDCTDLSDAAELETGGAPSTAPIVWTFARALLTDALITDGRSGLHDVSIERDGAYLAITLTSPDGTATLRFLRQALIRFVLRTEQLVPLGRESEHLDVDTAIRRLLGGVR